jgi:hypothetical protein
MFGHGVRAVAGFDFLHRAQQAAAFARLSGFFHWDLLFPKERAKSNIVPQRSSAAFVFVDLIASTMPRELE